MKDNSHLVFCSKCNSDTFIVDEDRTVRSMKVHTTIEQQMDISRKTIASVDTYLKCKHCGHPLDYPVNHTAPEVKLTIAPKNHQ